MSSLRLQMTTHIREWDRVMTKAESFVNPPREWMYTRFCSQSTCAWAPGLVSTRRKGCTSGCAVLRRTYRITAL